MRLFIQISFWVGVLGFVCRMISLACADYPRKVTKGTDATTTIIGVVFTAWAAYLLWG